MLGRASRVLHTSLVTRRTSLRFTIHRTSAACARMLSAGTQIAAARCCVMIAKCFEGRPAKVAPGSSLEGFGAEGAVS